jgi:hypothetical protein
VGVIIIGTIGIQKLVLAPQNQTLTQIALASTETAEILHTPTTSTPTFTRTPEPTPTSIGASIGPIRRIIRTENFDRLPLAEFHLLGNYSLADGILRFEEPLVSGDPWSDGEVRLDSMFSVNQGDGYILLFRTTETGTQFLVTFEFGPFNDPTYRSFWFNTGQSISIWKGQSEFFTHKLDIPFRQNTWYYLLMRPYRNNVEIRLWEKDHPDNISYSTLVCHRGSWK